jgi:hypothetical protein
VFFVLPIFIHLYLSYQYKKIFLFLINVHSFGHMLEGTDSKVSCGTEMKCLSVGLGGGSLEFVIPDGGARQEEHGRL